MNRPTTAPQGRRALVALLACLDIVLVAFAVSRVLA